MSLPDSGRVEVGDDTLVPRARALDGHGDSVAATIVWERLDTTVQVVDSFTGATVGLIGGQTGRVQARVGNLRSNPLTLTVLSPGAKPCWTWKGSHGLRSSFSANVTLL